jgi:recombination protein RecR
LGFATGGCVMLPKSLENLISELSRLPGVGPRTAERLAFYVLRNKTGYNRNLAESLLNLHDSIQICINCHHLSEANLCVICADSKRDAAIIAVVEEPLDVIAIEKTGAYRGHYHVLGGVLSPLEGIGPEDINIKSLLERVKKQPVAELILATNPSTEGETTAMYIQKQIGLNNKAIKVTRLARGLPMGSDLEYADQITLERALEGRQSW